MIIKNYYMTRTDGVKLYKIYSDITPLLKQIPTGNVYECWIYKVDENGNETNVVDWKECGVIDVENAPYTYEEVQYER